MTSRVRRRLQRRIDKTRRRLQLSQDHRPFPPGTTLVEEYQMIVQRARELLDYDPATGLIHWKVGRGNRKPGTAVSSYRRGYPQVKIDGRKYQAHRLAWLIHHGRWPDAMLDHRNGRRNDNRLDNLREATWAENNANIRGAKRNNTLGVRGVRLTPSGRLYGHFAGGQSCA